MAALRYLSSSPLLVPDYKTQMLFLYSYAKKMALKCFARFRMTPCTYGFAGDSNFPDGGHGWGHVILGKLEYPRIRRAGVPENGGADLLPRFFNFYFGQHFRFRVLLGESYDVCP